MKKVCIVTGTRAEYYLLKPVIERIRDDIEMELNIIVTGMHLSEKHGNTYTEIEKNGFRIDGKVDMHLSDDSSKGITKSMGYGMIGFADQFESLKPDLVILLGDRFEALVAAEAAMIARIPIAHIHGGETTVGVIDEAIRHGITKMSYLHFAATETYRNRIIQLGEQPDRVFNVGALGVENIQSTQLLDRCDLEKKLGLQFQSPTFVITYHPETLNVDTGKSQFENLLIAMDSISEASIIFTKANGDMGGNIINKWIDEYVKAHPGKAVAFTNLGIQNYFSTLKYADVVVGNSSSGIIEAPSFGIPTVNIGDRQKGRCQADSIIQTNHTVESIQNGIMKALTQEFKKKASECINPYEGKEPSRKIVEIIKEYLVKEKITLNKAFYDIQ